MTFDFFLHLMDDREFEVLVVCICDELLGKGTVIFADRNDGGRDARFTGKAQSYPSTESLWEGQFIVQAKHTRNPTGKCSDADFQREVKNEIVKLTSLVAQSEADNYLLFTNRSLTGESDSKIRKKITDETKVDKNALIGKERIVAYLNFYPRIAEAAGLNKYAVPLAFYEDDLKNLILYFHEHSNDLSKQIEKKEEEIKRVPLDEKNGKNNLSKEYFSFMLQQSLSYFDQIDTFLKDPKNKKLLEGYYATVTELNSKIISHRDQFDTFDEIFDYLYDFILKRNETEIKDSRRLIYVFLHFMYYNCDIGVK